LNEAYKEVVSELVDAEEIIQEINKIEPVTLEQLVFMFRSSPKVEIPVIEIPAPVFKKEELVEEEYKPVFEVPNPVVQLEEKIEEEQTSNIVAYPVLEEKVIEEIPFFQPLEKEIEEEILDEEAPELEIAAPEIYEEVKEVVMEIVVTEPDKVEIVDKIKTAPIQETVVEEKYSLNELLKPQNKKMTVLEHANQNKAVDIKSLITINQRFMFVNELFKGESKVFQETLEKVQVCGSYNEAINMLLDNYANRYDWDTDKEEVAEFFDLISRTFVTE
jgi:hypothetical protein